MTLEEINVQPAERRSRRVRPQVLAALLAVLILVNVAVLAWRWVAQQSEPAHDYYTYQVQRWEAQLLNAPDDPAVWSTLGGLYDDMGDEVRAFEAYEKALELDPDSPSALLFLGKRAEAEGSIADARSKVQQAIDGLPETGRYLAYFELGELERGAGETEAAIAAYEKSIADSGVYWNAHYQLALLYEEVGRLDDSLVAAQKARMFTGPRQDLDQLIERLKSSGATAPAEETNTMGAQ